MVHIRKFLTLKETIQLLQQEMQGESISVEKILNTLSGRGRPLLLILLSLPFCQPIQIPGFSTPFGLLIAFFGFRMTFGKHVWLPKKILSKEISNKTLQIITDKALILLDKAKVWIHPRLFWLCHSPTMEMMNGLAIFILGLLLALPLPIPFSNMTAAWSILLIALGTLEDDGLFVFLGYCIFFLTIGLFLALAIALKTQLFN